MINIVQRSPTRSRVRATGQVCEYFRILPVSLPEAVDEYKEVTILGELMGARTPIIQESEATGQTAELYAAIRDHFGLGVVPDVFKLTGARPDFLQVLWGGFVAMFDGGVLPRQVKEMLATVVSKGNSCRFCIQAHSMLLRSVGGTPEAVAAAEVADIDALPVEAKYKALLRFGQQITVAAYKITDEDFESLHAAGLNDEEILEGAFVASLFNAINRMADTFGLYELMQLREPAQK